MHIKKHLNSMGKPKEELTEKEIAKRRDETLKRKLKTPPKPHSEMTGDSKKKTKPKGSQRVDTSRG